MSYLFLESFLCVIFLTAISTPESKKIRLGFACSIDVICFNSTLFPFVFELWETEWCRAPNWSCRSSEEQTLPISLRWQHNYKRYCTKSTPLFWKVSIKFIVFQWKIIEIGNYLILCKRENSKSFSSGNEYCKRTITCPMATSLSKADCMVLKRV